MVALAHQPKAQPAHRRRGRAASDYRLNRRRARAQNSHLGVARRTGASRLAWTLATTSTASDLRPARWTIASGVSDVGNPYLFQGRTYDPETGLYYFRARYLDPKTGRFLQRDPEGIWNDAYNLGNGYAFAGNNPVNNLDPSGENLLGKEQFVTVGPGMLYSGTTDAADNEPTPTPGLKGFDELGPLELIEIWFEFLKGLDEGFGESAWARFKRAKELVDLTKAYFEDPEAFKKAVKEFWEELKKAFKDRDLEKLGRMAGPDAAAAYDAFKAGDLKKAAYHAGKFIGSTARTVAETVATAGAAGAVKGAATAGTQAAAAGGRAALTALKTLKAAAAKLRQLRSLAKFKKHLPKGAGEVKVRDLPGGGKAFQAEVPGRVPGSKAVYEKQVDVTGQTTEFTKTTYGPDGEIIHVKDKIRGTTIAPEK